MTALDPATDDMPVISALAETQGDLVRSEPLQGQPLARVGNYALGEILGRGGMGVVYAARHVETGEEVAIKLLRAELLEHPGAMARFEREAMLTSSLKGKHAVRVFEVGVAKTAQPFLVMERLRGLDLGQILDGRGALGLAEALHWLIEACDAMAEAHDLGVVHRDLKPSNLFVATTADGPMLKVLDFGISRLAHGGSRLTATHAALGTPVYMSPEQAKSSRTADVRSDVWSLGVILYELLTAMVPFEGDSPTSIAINLCTLAPTPPSVYRPDIPVDVEALILRTLEKSPADRFESARELGEALRAIARAPQDSHPERSSPHVWQSSLASEPPSKTTPSATSSPTTTPPAVRPRVAISSWLAAAVAALVVAGVGVSVALPAPAASERPRAVAHGGAPVPAADVAMAQLDPAPAPGPAEDRTPAAAQATADPVEAPPEPVKSAECGDVDAVAGLEAPPQDPASPDPQEAKSNKSSLVTQPASARARAPMLRRPKFDERY